MLRELNIAAVSRVGPDLPAALRGVPVAVVLEQDGLFDAVSKMAFYRFADLFAHSCAPPRAPIENHPLGCDQRPTFPAAHTPTPIPQK